MHNGGLEQAQDNGSARSFGPGESVSVSITAGAFMGGGAGQQGCAGRSGSSGLGVTAKYLA